MPAHPAQKENDLKMLPSQQIRAMLPALAMQRLNQRRKAHQKQTGLLMSGQEEQQFQAMLEQDLGTWIMAINAYLDGRAQVMAALERPSSRLRPALSIDGNKWMAMYGLDLQQGVGGFGDTPEEAMLDFDKNWLNAESNKKVIANMVNKDPMSMANKLCESDGIVLTTSPLQLRCRICGTTWTTGPGIKPPVCVNGLDYRQVDSAATLGVQERLATLEDFAREFFPGFPAGK